MVMPEIIVKLGDNIIQKYFFCQDRLTVGRALESDIVIENLAISRTHAIIEREGDNYFVSDQNSSNGTLINGTRIQRAQILNRDIISIGKYQLFFFDTHASEDRRRAMPCDQERTMLVPAAQEPLPAELVVTRGRQKGLRFSLASPTVSIGRGSDNTIRLTDWFVSRNHAIIERRGEQYVIRDLDSWRHTSVNGRNVSESALANGDVIGLGPSVELGFEVSANAQPLARPRFPHEFMAPPESSPEPEPNDVAQAPESQPAEPADQEIGVPEQVDDVFDFPEEQIEPERSEPVEAVSEPQSEPQPEPELVAVESRQSELRSVVEDLAVVSLHIAAVETSQDINRELNIKSAGAADARQQVDEIHMWENALKNKSLAIRRQAARRLKQLTGHDYDYE